MAGEVAQAALVEMNDGFVTYHRWQSAWIEQAITWESKQWDYQQFEWSGIVAGAAISRNQAIITAPAIPSIESILNQARIGRWLVTIRVYQFPESSALAGPPATMTLVGSAIGEVVGMSATQTQIELQLGSALSPVGAQFPPLLATNALIGVPCRL